MLVAKIITNVVTEINKKYSKTLDGVSVKCADAVYDHSFKECGYELSRGNQSIEDFRAEVFTLIKELHCPLYAGWKHLHTSKCKRDIPPKIPWFISQKDEVKISIDVSEFFDKEFKANDLDVEKDISKYITKDAIRLMNDVHRGFSTQLPSGALPFIRYLFVVSLDVQKIFNPRVLIIVRLRVFSF